jgi:ABC-type nitrate/sulfonate/bicarbonate transport system substrate-binding protein
MSREINRSKLSRRAALQLGAASVATTFAFSLGARAKAQGLIIPEKDELTLGFIKLTDMAPLAIAKELGFFEEEGLYVTLEAQANWKVTCWPASRSPRPSASARGPTSSRRSRWT